MKFMSAHEKNKLIQILTTSSYLQTANDRSNLLAICELDTYSNSIQIDQSSDKFAMSIFNNLSRRYISVENHPKERLALIVFLENIIAYDSSLSREDRNFIQGIINHWEQRQRASEAQPKQLIQTPKQTRFTPERPLHQSPAQHTGISSTPVSLPVRQQPVPKPPTLTVGAVGTLSKKVWFIMLPMIPIWVIVGKCSQQDIRSEQMLIALLVFGATGGLLSGMGGWFAWWLVDNSVKWEQAIPCSIVGAVGGAFGWALVGMTVSTVSNDILQSNGHVLGFIMGLIAVAVMLWWLALMRSRA